MIIRLDAKAAADHIRAAFHQRPAADPDVRHAHAFAEEVCSHLDVEPTANHVTHVVRLLHEAGIAPHLVEEYPKMATREATQADVDAHHARVVGEVIPILDDAGNPVVHEGPHAEKASHHKGAKAAKHK